MIDSKAWQRTILRPSPQELPLSCSLGLVRIVFRAHPVHRVYPSSSPRAERIKSDALTEQTPRPKVWVSCLYAKHSMSCIFAYIGVAFRGKCRLCRHIYHIYIYITIEHIQYKYIYIYMACLGYCVLSCWIPFQSPQRSSVHARHPCCPPCFAC